MHSYRERLYAPPLWWVVGTLTFFTFGAIAWTGFDLAITVAIFASLFLIEAAFLVNWGRTTITVGGGELTIGKATLRLGEAGAVHPLDAAQFRALRGPRADPHAYMLIRPYLKDAVYVEVTSPDAPWPYWLVATRRPAELATAIELSRPIPRSGGRAMG